MARCDEARSASALAPESEEALAEKRKASVRAKVEHPVLYVKRHFGYAKVRYRGLAKKHATAGVAAGVCQLDDSRAPLGGVTREKCAQIRLIAATRPRQSPLSKPKQTRFRAATA